MSKFDIKDIVGVIPALITPFDIDENFDEQATRKLVQYLLKQEIGGLYLTGSTGEAFLMDTKERQKVVEVVIDEVKGQVPVIVHVGAISTKISIEHAKHAHRYGADAISSVPPFYWKFSNDDIYNYYKDITESTPLPMIVYNIPLAGIMGYDMIMKLGEIEGVKGIKYTASTHYDILRIKQDLGKDFIVYSGSDEMAVSGLTFKSDGIIGSFYNIMPEIFIEIDKYIKESNIPLAIERQEVANKIIFKALEYDYIALMKTMLSWIGIDCGYSRKPFTSYKGLEEEKIKAEFKKLRDDNKITGVKFLEKL